MSDQNNGSYFLKQNGILINQLTQVVNTYDKLQRDCQTNKTQLQDDVVPELQRIVREKKALETEVAYIESKLKNLDNNLPDMIKEIMEYYITEQSKKDQETYVTYQQMKEASKKKLDCTVFRQFADQQLAKQSIEDLAENIENQLVTI